MTNITKKLHILPLFLKRKILLKKHFKNIKKTFQNILTRNVDGVKILISRLMKKRLGTFKI